MKNFFLKFYNYVVSDCDCITYSILRVFLVALIWTKWSKSFRFFVNDDPIFIITAVLFYSSSFLLFFGYFSRVSNVVLTFCCFWYYYYFGMYLGNSSIIHHHTYLLCISCLILCFSPSGRFFSLDNYLRKEDGKNLINGNFRFGPRWPLLVFCFQLTMIYIWGVYSKINILFLSGASLDYIFFDLYRLYVQFISTDLIKDIYALLAAFVIFVELFLAFGFWFRRTRLLACFFGLIVHATFYILLPVSTFSATMFLLYICFFEPSEVRKIVEKIAGYKC